MDSKAIAILGRLSIPHNQYEPPQTYTNTLIMSGENNPGDDAVPFLTTLHATLFSTDGRFDVVAPMLMKRLGGVHSPKVEISPGEAGRVHELITYPGGTIGLYKSMGVLPPPRGEGKTLYQLVVIVADEIVDIIPVIRKVISDRLTDNGVFVVTFRSPPARSDQAIAAIKDIEKKLPGYKLTPPSHFVDEMYMCEDSIALFTRY